jgi:hypothetical protein
MNDAIEISMTTFIDFVVSSGTSRIARVRAAKKQYEEGYDPKKDFWRSLRKTIIQLHEDGLDKKSLDEMVMSLTDPKKRVNYPECVKAYKKWLGRKKIEGESYRTRRWVNGRLCIRINPELALWIKDEQFVIKYYFKPSPLSKAKVDCILHLIEITYPKSFSDAIPGILDVRRGRLITPTREVQDIDALLTGEAAALLAMFDQV